MIAQGAKVVFAIDVGSVSYRSLVVAEQAGPSNL